MNQPHERASEPTVAQGATAILADFVSRFTFDDVPQNCIDASIRSLADTFCVAVAGNNEAAAKAALNYLDSAGLLSLSATQPKHAWLWGTQYFAAAETAAWWNGVSGHVLDFDDVTVPMRGHPSVVLWPALLALAQARNIAGTKVIAAFVAGFEVISKLSKAFAFEQYAAGWHTTASIGSLGSTLACCNLLGLSAGQTSRALGLALAQVAGARANVGSDAKSFQAGHANGLAVRAALLAEQNFDACVCALEGSNGYLQLYAQSAEVTRWLVELGQLPLELETSGLDVKQYPMCYATHRALDAVFAICKESPVEASAVRAIRVHTSNGALVPLVHPNPGTGLEGKFSLPYAMAAAMLDGAVNLQSFTDENVQRPQVAALMRKVTDSQALGPSNPRWAEVTLELTDGSVLFKRVETLRGSSSAPVSMDELFAKLDGCLAWRGSCVGTAAEIYQIIKQLPGQHDVSTLVLALSKLFKETKK